MSLIFECGYCARPVEADTTGWEELCDENGTYPRHRVHAWLGERVMTALDSHIRTCEQAPPNSDGRPDLRLVVSR